MLILLPQSRAPDFKIIRILLFVFFTFFIVGNSYADKIYKVQENDFLSKIVKKNYSIDRNISKEQVMVAILRANPEAFRGGNIHFLKRVDALTLPSTEAVALIPHDEALRTVNKHYTFFKRNKTGNFSPIPLKRPAQNQAKTTNDDTKTEDKTPTNTIEDKKISKSDIEKNTSSTEDITSSTSSIDSNLAKQQQTTTIKTEKIQELEQRKKEQNATLDQLDSKIKTLEKSITNHTTTPQSNMSGLDSLTNLSDLNDDSNKTDNDAASQSETISNLDSLTNLSDLSDDSNKTNNDTASQSETISNLDSLTNLNDLSDDSNEIAEKTSASSKLTYLWLFLPIFALLGLLWWKKSKTSNQTDTNLPSVSLEKRSQAQPKQTQTKKSLHSNIEKAPVNNIEEIDNTEEAATIHSNEKESAIKLDMASAYQEMGYPEEAKEMLEEVLKEGNAQQKEMAESLLAVL